ncbi:hypothetical protein D3C76_1167320 [compost metagenome]
MRVQRAGGVVQAEDGGRCEQCPGQAQALALAAGEGHAAIAERAVEAIGQAFEDILGGGLVQGLEQLFIAGAGCAQAQVGGQAVGEQEALLGQYVHAPAQVAQVQFANVLPA